jgi:hypothetical protein
VADLADTISEIVDRQGVERQAAARYALGTPGAASRSTRYQRYHDYYAPIDGDQWPKDRTLRPGKLHITANIVKPFVDTEARVLSLLPRVTNESDDQSLAGRKKAEVVEKLYARYLDATGWDVWMADLNRVKGIYGLGVLQPFWNNDENRPDVLNIEQPQNLMLGYGTSDFTVVDWAIYRYSISVLEASIRFPDLQINVTKKGRVEALRRGDHADPLNQKPLSGVSGLVATMSSTMGGRNNLSNRQRSEGEYERAQVEVWDYWYRKPITGTVCNATLVQGVMTGEVREHPEYPILPFIPIENDHEPGSPEGISSVEALMDLQLGLNRVYSHLSQIVADNSGNSYQLTGENADMVPENLVPAEDRIIPAGSGNQILPIARNVNNFPLEALIKQYWDAAHKITGIPEVMFGNLPGSQTSGRAMAVQIEAAANRIDPKRRRLYDGLRTLLLFWGFMLKKKNPSVTISSSESQPETAGGEVPAIAASTVKIGDYIQGFEKWKLIAPEITPRDQIEATQNVVTLVQAKLLPLEVGMDQLGIENPQYMLSLIEKERSNPRLFPGDAQSYLATIQLLQAIQQQQAAADAAQKAQSAANGALADTQEMTPTKTEDMNQPPTMEGSAPPGGSPAPGGGIGAELQPLIRQTPSGDSQAMSQIMLPRTGF